MLLLVVYDEIREQKLVPVRGYWELQEITPLYLLELLTNIRESLAIGTSKKLMTVP